MNKTDSSRASGAWLIVVTGWTGAGKSTVAAAVADDLSGTVASFDWVMSALRSQPDVWASVELPLERQRRVGWDLLSRIAEQQLARGSSCVLDLVARQTPRTEWEQLAARYEANFGVIECVCSDEAVHRQRIEGRQRNIPGWYELDWERVANGRRRYELLASPKLELDAVNSLDDNLARVRSWLVDEAAAQGRS